ncbi:hypothetical protein JCM21900_002158 [Sporobolomyces salmonicolor]
MRSTRTSPPRPPRAHLLLALVVALALFPRAALAFFDFFHPPSGAGTGAPPAPPSYEDQFERVACAHFVCPDWSCARAPAACPCPSRIDDKCELGGADGAYVCARDCARVRRAVRVG